MNKTFIPTQTKFIDETLSSLGFTIRPIMENADGEFVQFFKKGVELLYTSTGQVWVQYVCPTTHQLVWTDEGYGFHVDNAEDEIDLINLISRIYRVESK